MIITVYPSGSIEKGSDYQKRFFWTDLEKNAVRIGAKPHDIKFYNPNDYVPELGNTSAMFGRDMYQIKIADFVIVDAREGRGIGVGIEILASRIFGTPLLVVAPTNSHYRRDEISYRENYVSDYMHPHLEVLADKIVDNFEDAGDWIKSFIKYNYKIKDLNSINKAIEEYKNRILKNDVFMQEIMKYSNKT